ncbi:hypothetical protein Q0590_07890 [Rhodocytophaga aerolata]|uniref:DUF5004 domain-containing protein n=1 Tax=Rhodocytophaga aerolata TaxID=455078 RepID=A0ABT8R4F4_9BACT|nr:hypothetical protein [Rhodocytophaga aerolata]MDO1446168.1 hypothetical protein [Rhodocytophaga aerolata]
MKRYSALLFALLLSICIISGCKKDDEPKQPTKTDILTGRDWKFQDLFAFGQNLTTLGVAQYLGGVTNSNFKFNKDGSYIATNRTTNATTPGKWEFGSNETTLILDKGTADETTFDIVTLTDKNLDLRFSINKNEIDSSLLPANLRALLVFADEQIPVDVKLIPAE